MKKYPAATLQHGQSPLLISIPHAGLELPDSIRQRLSPAARTLPDTDWYVDRLYGFAHDLGATVIAANCSRYVVDLNRPPDNAPLYSQAETRLVTGLTPLHTFHGDEVYRDGMQPDTAEIDSRLDAYWHPYHDLLSSELGRLRDQHGYALLLDAHSICSRVPLLFEGQLPDLNLGSNGGNSAAASLLAAATAALRHKEFSLVVDGRFKGGYITRHYGEPANGIHALQLEMAQSAYMNEQPPEWREEKAARAQVVLRQLLQAMLNWNPGHA